MGNSAFSQNGGDTAVEKATLAGGCFWCLEAVFRGMEGVVGVVSGYTGGVTPSPAYEEVCSGRTGHAEAVQVTFDPEVISYRDILLVFFSVHDPTTLNRQGPDSGTQYRSAVFYHNEAQKAVAEQVIGELTRNEVWPDPVVTEVSALRAFYPAEEYHQRYYEKHPDQGYCRVVISPKLDKFRKDFRGGLHENIDRL